MVDPEYEAEYWAIDLDDFIEQISAANSHQIVFAGARDTAKKQIIKVFADLVDNEMYRATKRGYREE